MYIPFCTNSKPPLNTHADKFSRHRGLKFGSSLPLLPYIVYVRSDGSLKTVHMGRQGFFFVFSGAEMPPHSQSQKSFFREGGGSLGFSFSHHTHNLLPLHLSCFSFNCLMAKVCVITNMFFNEKKIT